MTVKWCRTAAVRTSSFRNAFSVVDATMTSILRQAEMMSLRNDGSRRIDDSGIFERRGANPGLQATSGNQVDLTSYQRCQFLSELFELDQTDACSLLEFHDQVDVAVRPHLIAG